MNQRRGLARALALLRKRRLERELSGEIEAHLELAARDAERTGMSPEDARLAAHRSFGGIEPMKEEHREQRSFVWVETLVRDFRYGVSSLWNDPGFTLVAVAVLALGIGANAAMFSLVDALFLKPLPFPHPERIVRVWEAPELGSINGINTMDLLDWKRMNTAFDALSAERPATAALTGAGEPVRLPVMLVSADYFQVFGVSAQIGRTFRKEEEESGASATIVISHATWQARFGGDPEILDRAVMLDGEPHQVVGVLPPGAFDRDETSIWKTLIYKPEQMNRGFHWLRAVARLKPGVTIEQAQQELTAIDKQLSDLSPDWKRDWGVAVERFDKRLVGEKLRQSIYIAFGAVVMVLLIACANVANLQIARGVTRRKEMALRAALGAGRGRLTAQLLTETLVLCLAGAVAGMGIAYGLLQAAKPLLGTSLPFTADLGLDLRVTGFALGAALLVTLLVGLLPSIQTSFGNLSQAINQGARGSSSSREMVRRTIVTCEVAVSLLLVCGALLLFKSLLQLQQVETGVRLSNVITTSVDLPLGAYPNSERAAAFYGTISERLRAISGVEQVSLSTDLPLEGVRQGMGISVPGRDGGSTIRYKRVDENYFSAFGIPILAGRSIQAQDRAGTPLVVVINEELAAQLKLHLELDNPVGKIVTVGTPNYLNSTGSSPPMEVVGVVRNERIGALDAAGSEPVAYVSLAQVPRQEVKLILLTQIPPATVLPEVRATLRQVDPTLALGEVRTMEQIHERSLSGATQPAWVIGVFGAVAVLLAALGIYGVVAHSVSQRRREIGIRMAMGARSFDVLSHLIRNGMMIVGLGLAIGLVGTFALTRLMQSQLFQVSALDPSVIVAACVCVVLVGIVATLLPASRAAMVEPVTVLRDEG
ncbi:MAG: ABC transporter permease [Bryobacterales bacterium]|nr:ABC transporter permease [Bryobacterales bacterium]